MDTRERIAPSERVLLGKIATLEREWEGQRSKNRLLFYNNPQLGERVHGKQLEFHRCLKRNRWVFGGNRSGKTECGAAEAAWLLRGNHPYRPCKPNAVGWIVSVSYAVQREVAQKKLLSYLNPDWVESVTMRKGQAAAPTDGIIDSLAVRNVFGGLSRVYFKSCEAGREKFQGAALDFVWFDEEPPEEIYEECRMRVLDGKGDIFGTMTPLKGLTFAYGKLFKNERADPQIWSLFMEWADNPYLDGEEVCRMSASLSGAELERRRYGRFASATGLVYPEFDESVCVIPPFDVPYSWQDRLSIDPGLNNPLSCHWYAVDGEGNVYAVAEHYVAGKDIGWHCDAIKRISTAIGWHADANGRIDALLDSAANQRTLAAQKSAAQLFFENGIAADTRVDKNIFAGIARVKQYLRPEGFGPRLYIFDTCVHLIRELKGYFWGENDVPKKRDDHALDELRYYLMTRPQPHGATREKGELEQYKDKLIRRVSRARR